MTNTGFTKILRTDMRYQYEISSRPLKLPLKARLRPTLPSLYSYSATYVGRLAIPCEVLAMLSLVSWTHHRIETLLVRCQPKVPTIPLPASSGLHVSQRFQTTNLHLSTNMCTQELRVCYGNKAIMLLCIETAFINAPTYSVLIQQRDNISVRDGERASHSST